ncbi:hypothetical protein TanjilG_02836 [Lupinus angustifolius]|uniref:C2H2-type domain-containing protein n=1 Tax=Lupinus angustifolius TaxID=3871 RepID=A0A4P1RLU2_LUPAN|nr:hypothetical protein TanjilG_02836 [Lupinus angustifolius]
MTSNNLLVTDLSDSGSAGTNNKTYKCIECFKPFSNRAMLIQHQREDEPCRSSQKIIQQYKPQPSLEQPLILLPPSPIVEANTSSLGPLPSVVQHSNEAEIRSGYSSPDTTFSITNLRLDTMQIDGDDYYDDHFASPDDRTLDLISQLDPTRNLLYLIDKQSAGPSGNAGNDVDAAPGQSGYMGTVDLNLKLSMV